MLQVDPGADDVVIHAAYRALVKRHHPDVGGSGELVRAINAAYATLSDPNARRAYDAESRPAPRAAPSLGAGNSRVPKLGAEFRRRFTPREAPGAWLFDFVGTPVGLPHDHVWVKRCQHGDAAEASAFAAAVRAARVARPTLGRRFDVFVAMLGRCTEPFGSMLREPRGPIASLSYAVVAIDLAARELRTVGGTASLPAVWSLWRRGSPRGTDQRLVLGERGRCQSPATGTRFAGLGGGNFGRPRRHGEPPRNSFRPVSRCRIDTFGLAPPVRSHPAEETKSARAQDGRCRNGRPVGKAGCACQ
jgi:DnaJ-like protein